MARGFFLCCEINTALLRHRQRDHTLPREQSLVTRLLWTRALQPGFFKDVCVVLKWSLVEMVCDCFPYMLSAERVLFGWETGIAHRDYYSCCFLQPGKQSIMETGFVRESDPVLGNLNQLKLGFPTSFSLPSCLSDSFSSVFILPFSSFLCLPLCPSPSSFCLFLSFLPSFLLD